jgi:hypothetical protein
MPSEELRPGGAAVAKSPWELRQLCKAERQYIVTSELLPQPAGETLDFLPEFVGGAAEFAELFAVAAQ